jgi:hypothetical protein
MPSRKSTRKPCKTNLKIGKSWRSQNGWTRSEFEELFDGTLGNWKTEPVELELNKGEKPHSSRYHPMPRIHKATFKKELLRLCDIGVLEEV